MSARFFRHVPVFAFVFALVFPFAAGCSADDTEESADTAVPVDAVSSAVDQLPDLARAIMEKSGIPGMAVAVVHNGETVYAEGFGVRVLGEDTPIDPDTVFMLASMSKSIGASVVATLVGEGVVSWDDPVIEHLPDFALADPYVTEHATIGDYYSHRTGIPHAGGDLLEDIGYDREYILSRPRPAITGWRR